MSGQESENIRELLESRARGYSEKEFLISAHDGRRLTYEEFNREVDLAAELLLRLGVTKGRVVSLFLSNNVEYLIFYFACFKTGAWAGPVNALLKSHEVAFIVNDSRACVIVTQPDLYPVVAEARRAMPSLAAVILAGGSATESIDDAMDESVVRYSLSEEGNGRSSSLADAGISRDDEAMIIYTSGTTGRPKGVLLTHGNLLSNARQIGEWLGLGGEDRALMIMPLFHVNALMTTGLAALHAGGSIVLAPRFRASLHWKLIAEHGVTYFGSVATMLALLNQTYPGGVPEGLDVSRLRFALCGSAPVPVEVMKTFESLFPCPVIEGYGLSESTCRSTFNPPDERRRIGSVGLPIGNEVRVFDDEERELGPREVGEIVLRGPNIMKGYFGNEDATREAFRSGWFHTGDLGYVDEDGFFYIVDRKSDMIIRGGENIYPREIDEVLYRHPKVKDAATIGIPDPLYGEEVKAYVVLRSGQSASEQELIEFCRGHLADFKCPRSVEFLEEIPKGPTGKLLKRMLSGG
ncbi:MAG TPA: long-chain-fatty-acid--CoA ligase [Blastocatellia bacterium]|nr:long-chain-fatty-acid--CoA ligase [Blastocatellia bacterium]